jgi:hypothetical protein
MTFDNRSHNFKAGIDYTINKQSSIGAIANGNIGDPVFLNNSRTPIIYNPTGVTDRILVANNRNEMQRNTMNYNLNYNYTGKSGKSLVLNADYGAHNLDNNQMQPNMYYSPSGAFIRSSVYQMITPTEINISSLKADYEQNFAKGKLGIGSKVSFVNTDNDFQGYNIDGNNVKWLDKDKSNRFKYSENINAGYVNYNRVLKAVQPV